MKQRYLSLTILLFFHLMSEEIFAQQKNVSGIVSDSRGNALPGVNVIVKGSTLGTATDSNGHYVTPVPEGFNTLLFSFVGFLSMEVEIGNQTVVDIALGDDVRQLNEVVVTALNIERNTKALQSSVTQLSGDNFTQARENNLGNALAGRVAGVVVNKIATGPAGSTRVIIRGAKTLGIGSSFNQPLYVVDGIPMDNTVFGQAGAWGGADLGDGLNSISPDDIQSITVLKGAASAALYGSRAATGVILITTKKGNARKGVGIEFNSNFIFEKVNNLTDFQTTNGSGGLDGPTLQTQVAKTAGSLDELWKKEWSLRGWGPKFDGSSVVQFDGIFRPYEYKGDNFANFFETGTSATNSLAFSGGSETQNFRFSVSNLNSKGIIPNSSFDRLSLSLNINSKFGDKVTLTAKMMYSHEDVKNRPNVSDSPGNTSLAVYYTPGDVNITDLQGDPNKPGAVPSVQDQQDNGITIYDGKEPGEEMQVSSNTFTQNPYWSAYQFRNDDVRDRIIPSGQLRYDITKFLYAEVKGGMDQFTRRGTRLTPQGTGFQRGGGMNEYEYRAQEVNLEYMVGFNKTFGNINVNVFAGGNRMRKTFEVIAADGVGFNVPFFAAINNAAQRGFIFDEGATAINSLFGSGEISYNNYVFLTATVREDWFSALDQDNNNIVYPSVGASFVFSDAFNNLPGWLSFGKVRTSWAQVGNAGSVAWNDTHESYALGTSHLDRPTARFSSRGNIPNVLLRPFRSEEFEVGMDIRFSNNRIGLDLAYYSQTTTDDILNSTISPASGFRTTTVNLGKLTNSGMEVLLSARPVQGVLTWDVSLNFAQNNSEVVSLLAGQNSVVGEFSRTFRAQIEHIVGYPYGMITGFRQKTSPDGQLVYNADGAPIAESNPRLILGRGVPDFTGGLTNTLTYKQISLSFLIDFRSGGKIYSGTNVRMTQAGFTKETLQGRAGESPLTVTGVTDSNNDGTYEPFTKTLTPGEAANYWQRLGADASENFVYDASFIKLRSLTFGYSLPKSMLVKTPFQTLTFSFVARNLAILFKNTPNIDPESNFSSGNSQGLDYFGVPATRSYGFNLALSF